MLKANNILSLNEEGKKKANQSNFPWLCCFSCYCCRWEMCRHKDFFFKSQADKCVIIHIISLQQPLMLSEQCETIEMKPSICMSAAGDYKHFSHTLCSSDVHDSVQPRSLFFINFSFVPPHLSSSSLLASTVNAIKCKHLWWHAMSIVNANDIKML